MHIETRKIIEKWYRKLNFSKKYDEQFYDILDHEDIDETVAVDEYSKSGANGRKNFIMQLYFFENLHKEYVKKGISIEIFDDTVYDLVRWTDIWSEIKGELWLEELLWLNQHLSMRLFKIGRLQYCLYNSPENVEEFGIKKDDNVIDVHIPAAGPLELEKCISSLSAAVEFFEKYFPEHDYRFFMCHSWLLDNTLKKYLSNNSNILKFQSLFSTVRGDKSYDILKYIFKWNTTVENLEEFDAKSEFAKKIKRAVL